MAEKKPAADLSKYRNIGIIAHIDAGKTTTTEHLLFYSGAIHKLGTVDAGTTETDYHPEEQQRGITIYSACIPFHWRDCTINLIDTPGHVDFTAEVERALRVLDGAVVVFDAQKGVEAQSETVWRQADRYAVPRLVFINKMDVVGANFANALDEIRDRLEGRPVPLFIPIGAGSSKDSTTPFAGIIDIIEQKALYFDPATQGKSFRSDAIPDDLRAEADAAREKLFDVLTEKDEHDRLTTAYLEGKEIPPATIRQVIREQTIKRYIQPVLCGSGREHIGIQPLLDAVVDYLPSPLDRPPVVGLNPRGREAKSGTLTRKPDPKEPFCGLVFKVVADPHGEVFFVRIYSGTLKPQSRVYNPGKDCKELVSKVHHVYADPTRRGNFEELPGGSQAGDIVVLTSLRESTTGDTLCDPHHPIVLETIKFPEGVVSQSIEPESSADKDKLTQSLNLLKREDPTFSWRIDPETGQIQMSGMGLLHLEIKQHRLERDFNLKVRVRKPRVSYRETIRRPVRLWGECIRANIEPRQYARVELMLEHQRGEQPITFVNPLPEETLRPSFARAVEEGVRQALLSGELGFPVADVKVTVVAAQEHATDSSELAFQWAATEAVNEALKDNIVLLEPVMRLEVEIPEEYLGPVTADLNARRADIREIHSRGKLRTIEALVPLARMFDYSERVRSSTQGRATWTMEPSYYSPAPDEVLRSFLGGDDLD
jgi:elongation factor G